MLPALFGLRADPQRRIQGTVLNDRLGSLLSRSLEHPLEGIAGPLAQHNRVIKPGGTFPQYVVYLAIALRKGLGDHLVY